MKILRDPLWQFVGVVIAIIPIGIGIVTSAGSRKYNQSTPRITAHQNMNIRKGPGTNFDRIGVLITGDHLDILGISADDRWYYVLLSDGNTGWVVAASSAGEVSGLLGTLTVIVPTNTPTSTPTMTHSPTDTPVATDISEPTATETQAPTATPTYTDSPTSTTAPSDTPQPPNHTPTVDATPTEAQEVAIATLGVITSTSHKCSSQFGIEMVSIPAITFMMGSPEGIGEDDERPQREITLDAFCIDVYEVTNESYRACVDAGECTPPQRNGSRLVREYYPSSDYNLFPVINVTWEQAQEFCSYRDGRLPTEAEWELAARLDSITSELYTYAWGDEAPSLSRANFSGVGIGDVVAIRQHTEGRSPLGIFDLNGNVAEWVADFYSFYDPSHVYNPIGDDSGSERVVRGGSYINNAEDIRSVARDSEPQATFSDRIGFRCVVNVS